MEKETGQAEVQDGRDALEVALVAPVQVRVSRVRRAELRSQATVVGVVAAFRKATVGAEVDGRVVTRAVEPGGPVSTGQVLVALDAERPRISRDQAAALLRMHRVNAKQAATEFERGRNLFQRNFISQDRLDALGFAVQRTRSEVVAAKAQLAAAERALADVFVRAPFNGIAELVHVQVGDYLKKGVAVATLVDFSRARIRAGVTAAETELLGGAATAELALDALGEQRLVGAINSIARVSDPATGTYAVEIWLDADQLPLREGMLVTVHLPYAAGPSRPTVPKAAVFRRQGALHVFAIKDGRAHLTPVRTGRADSQFIEVVDGLAENDIVVIDGQFALRDGAPVMIVQEN